METKKIIISVDRAEPGKETIMSTTIKTNATINNYSEIMSITEYLMKEEKKLEYVAEKNIRNLFRKKQDFVFIEFSVDLMRSSDMNFKQNIASCKSMEDYPWILNEFDAWWSYYLQDNQDWVFSNGPYEGLSLKQFYN